MPNKVKETKSNKRLLEISPAKLMKRVKVPYKLQLFMSQIVVILFTISIYGFVESGRWVWAGGVTLLLVGQLVFATLYIRLTMEMFGKKAVIAFLDELAAVMDEETKSKPVKKGKKHD